jgi:methylglutaconyl-CoA hydratase
LAWEIAKNGPVAIRAAKEAIDVGIMLPNIQDGLQIERECYQRVIPTQDRLEGLAAFQEGGTPVYKGN